MTVSSLRLESIVCSSDNNEFSECPRKLNQIQPALREILTYSGDHLLLLLLWLLKFFKSRLRCSNLYRIGYSVSECNSLDFLRAKLIGQINTQQDRLRGHLAAVCLIFSKLIIYYAIAQYTDGQIAFGAPCWPALRAHERPFNEIDSDYSAAMTLSGQKIS